jgi:DNA-binding NarL/FixJ family response regulator
MMDVTMPDFEPISAIRNILSQYPDLKILIVSAYDDDVYVQGLLGAGVHGYHLKDQPLSDLQLAIERVLADERWISGPLISKLVGAGGHAETRASDIGGAPAYAGLSPRQQDLLRLLREGYDNQRIAQMVGLNIKTIEYHLTRLYRQLGVQSRLEAVNYANQHPEAFSAQAYDSQTAHDLTEFQESLPVSILIVDDNARFRFQLHHTIGKLYPGAQIYEAGDITTAVAQATQHTPDLALIDMVLRDDENGLRCTRRVKAISPTTRVILISAYPDREFHRQGLEAGAVALLDKKDLDVATLREVIKDLVE